MEKKHNLSEVLHVAEQMEVPANEAPEVTAKVMRLMVYTQYDLRGISDKVETIKSNPLCSGKWIVFLNKAGTLAHVMHADEADDGTYIRMTIRHNMKNVHENYIRRYFFNRMVARYII